MIRIIALSAIFATPAFAADQSGWGSALSDDYRTTVRLAPSDAPAVATVTIRNRLTGGHDATTAATLEIAGLSVRVTVNHGPGDAPDTITVTPPEGFIAVPPQIDVAEGQDAVIRIFDATGLGA